MIIFLAFFFPLAVYLLLLGLLNRGRHPLLVSGVWDGIGLIFGASGFLIFAGPAILSALSERWRQFWLFGPGVFSLAGGGGAWPVWLFLASFYFVLVVGGTVLYLRRQRHLTAIYNTNAHLIERLIADICKKLGLEPVCSGGLFVFGLSGRTEPGPDQMGLGSSLSNEPSGGLPSREVHAAGQELDQSAILEVDSFPLFHHVTLHWDPADSSLRRTVESELNRRLSETLSDDGLLGGWLLTLGFLLLSFDLIGVFFVILLNLHMFMR